MNAVKNVAQMNTFEGEYTLTDLIMKAALFPLLQDFWVTPETKQKLSDSGAARQVAGHHGQGTLTLKEINSRRRHRRQQLRGIKTAEGKWGGGVSEGSGWGRGL